MWLKIKLILSFLLQVISTISVSVAVNYYTWSDLKWIIWWIIWFIIVVLQLIFLYIVESEEEKLFKKELKKIQTKKDTEIVIQDIELIKYTKLLTNYKNDTLSEDDLKNFDEVSKRTNKHK